jgi:mevalonate kinase
MKIEQAKVFFNEGLEFLKMNGLEFSANHHSERLRAVALSYVTEIINEIKPHAIFLTGSSIVGCSGKGSDIDINVIVTGTSKPLQKRVFKTVPVDLQITSIRDWRDNSITGENVRYLTHSVPMYVNNSCILKEWQTAIKKYYSRRSYSAEYHRISNLLKEKEKDIEYLKSHNRLFLTALPLEWCLIDVINLLIYKFKGCPSNSTMLDEFRRISKLMGKTIWYSKSLELMRFDLSASTCRHLLFVYNRLFTRMRELIAEHDNIVQRIRKLKMGIFNASHALQELTTTINEKQLIDKVERMIDRKKNYNAGYAFFCEAWYNFFMFTPFFMLNNVDEQLSGNSIKNLPYNIGFESWDADIKKMWIEVSRTENICEPTILEWVDLNKEILKECKP